LQRRGAERWRVKQVPEALVRAAEKAAARRLHRRKAAAVGRELRRLRAAQNPPRQRAAARERRLPRAAQQSLLRRRAQLPQDRHIEEQRGQVWRQKGLAEADLEERFVDRFRDPVRQAQADV
jgi:hypothetical protein